MSIVSTKELNLSYGKHHVLKDVSMDIERNEITALIGPSGCGKSTFLKTLNRMNDLVPDCHITGQVLFEGTDIYSRKVMVDRPVLHALLLPHSDIKIP